jgi:large subunit ribosomal protein L25
MKLQANKREITGKKVKNLRSEGLTPASVFGPTKKSENIQVDKKDFIKLFRTVGFNKFFDLEISGEKPVKVLVKEIQKHPVNDNLISVGFYQVDENRKITVDVPVTFVGESPAVKMNLGFLIHQMDDIAVHCFPKDLPTGFDIDVSTLENPGDAVTVGDVKLPENVELDSSMDETSAIVYIGTAQKEEEPEPAATEEGATAEGEAAPAADNAAAAKTEEKK